MFATVLATCLMVTLNIKDDLKLCPLIDVSDNCLCDFNTSEVYCLPEAVREADCEAYHEAVGDKLLGRIRSAPRPRRSTRVAATTRIEDVTPQRTVVTEEISDQQSGNVTAQASTPKAETAHSPSTTYKMPVITSKDIAGFAPGEQSTHFFNPIYSTETVDFFQEPKKKGFGKCQTSLRVLRSSNRVLHVKLDRCLSISNQLGSDLNQALDSLEEARLNRSSALGSARLETELLKMSRALRPLEKAHGSNASGFFESQAAKDLKDCLDENSRLAMRLHWLEAREASRTSGPEWPVDVFSTMVGVLIGVLISLVLFCCWVAHLTRKKSKEEERIRRNGVANENLDEYYEAIRMMDYSERPIIKEDAV